MALTCGAMAPSGPVILRVLLSAPNGGANGQALDLRRGYPAAMPWQPQTPRRALERATAALLADPARSDGLIAQAASVTGPTAARARRGRPDRCERSRDHPAEKAARATRTRSRARARPDPA